MLIALAAAMLSALIAAIVSIIMTRYTLKHGPNYAEQISALHTTMESLAKTQEELRKQQAKQAERDEERHEAERKRLEAASWKPHVEIISVNEGREHVNKLSLSSLDKFRVTDVSLLSETGAKVYEIVKNDLLSDAVVGKNIIIPHDALTQLASRSTMYFQVNRLEGMIRFTAVRAETHEEIRHTGELKFTAEGIMVGNTMWFHVVG